MNANTQSSGDALIYYVTFRSWSHRDNCYYSAGPTFGTMQEAAAWVMKEEARVLAELNEFCESPYETLDEALADMGEDGFDSEEITHSFEINWSKNPHSKGEAK